MVLTPKQTQIAYRCPECGTTVFGIIGEFAFSADMLRLKCPCEKSALQVTVTPDREKFRFDVPCIFCRQDHHFTVSKKIVFGDKLFLLNCPYANMDIGFLGTKEQIDGALVESEKELNKLIGLMGAESISELQPEELTEDEMLPDAAVHDTIRYLVKELEAEGNVCCPCQGGTYETAMTKNGILVYCPQCGASYLFRVESVSQAESYLQMDKLELSNPRNPDFQKQ